MCDDYRAPYAFSGTIERVDISLGRRPGLGPEKEAALHARFDAGKE